MKLLHYASKGYKMNSFSIIEQMTPFVVKKSPKGYKMNGFSIIEQMTPADQ